MKRSEASLYLSNTALSSASSYWNWGSYVKSDWKKRSLSSCRLVGRSATSRQGRERDDLGMCGRDVAGRIVPARLLNPALTDMELSLRRMKPDWARLRLLWLRDGVQAPPRHGGFKDGRRSEVATGEDSTGQDVSFLDGFLGAILSTEGDFERSFVGEFKVFWGNEPGSVIFVWRVLENSLLFLSMVVTGEDFETVLGFVGDTTLALSAILFWGVDVV